MSVEDGARQLMSAGHQFNQNAIGVSSATASALNAAKQNLEQVRQLATESVAGAVSVLGGRHSTIGAIGATANSVAQKADNVAGAIEQAISALLNMDQAINIHSTTMNNVGEAILRGGS